MTSGRRVLRILCCWELGGGSGHLVILAALADQFRQMGDRVGLVSRDVVNARRWLPHREVPVYQAPRHDPPAHRRGPALSYADILLRRGYGDTVTLTALCDAWRSLFDVAGADLVIAEHAPTAMLAARIAKVPVVATGFGFVAPPAITPMSALLAGKDFPVARLQRVEDEAVAGINRVLDGFGAEPITSLAELFPAQSVFLATYPELDHYGPRDGATYYGVPESPGDFVEPAWPRGTGEKVFAYMHPGYPQFPVLLRQLADLNVRALVVAPGVTGDMAGELGDGRIRVQGEPVDMDCVTKNTRVIICHGGHGTLAQSLRGGVAPIVAPNFVEQVQSAWRLGRQGLAFAAHPDPGRLDFAELIDAALRGDAQHERAARFAARYPITGSSARMSAMADDMRRRVAGANPVLG